MNAEIDNSDGSTKDALEEYKKTRQVFERYLEGGKTKSGSTLEAIRHRNIKLGQYFRHRSDFLESYAASKFGIFVTTQTQSTQDKRYNPSNMENAIITVRVTSAHFEESMEIYPLAKDEDEKSENKIRLLNRPGLDEKKKEKYMKSVNETLVPIRNIVEYSILTQSPKKP